MRILKLTTIVSLLALTASPTYAAMHHGKMHRGKMHHMGRGVNGPTSTLPNNGSRGKSTKTGGPAGGASVH